MPVRRHSRTVITSGLLCCALILVVLFTSPQAFRSPATLVVMALIGTAAVLLQLRVRRDLESKVLRVPLWFNWIGIFLAGAALFPALLHLGSRLVQTLALGAVGSFAIGSAIILHSFRKQTTKPE